MAGSELEVVLDWAAGEGWNPGRHDAAAFAAVDPDGLMVGLVNGEPVAAIACPRYDGRFGFVGLYLVRSDHRGSGLGMSIWRAGHANLKGIVAGLDSVDAQVGHHERWAIAPKATPPGTRDAARRAPPRLTSVRSRTSRGQGCSTWTLAAFPRRARGSCACSTAS
jgi:hypothetical protein